MKKPSNKRKNKRLTKRKAYFDGMVHGSCCPERETGAVRTYYGADEDDSEGREV